MNEGLADAFRYWRERYWVARIGGEATVKPSAFFRVLHVGFPIDPPPHHLDL